MLDTSDLEKHEISKISNFLPFFRMNKSWLLGDEPVWVGARSGANQQESLEIQEALKRELKL